MNTFEIEPHVTPGTDMHIVKLYMLPITIALTSNQLLVVARPVEKES